MLLSSRFDMSQAITKAILESVGTDFLLLDGSRAMTGDLDLPYTKGIKLGNVILKHHDTEAVEYLQMVQIDGGGLAHLLIGTLAPESLTGGSNPFYMRTAVVNGAYFVFQTRAAGAYSSIAYMRNNDFVLYDGKTLKTNTIDETTTDSGVTLPHAGDISFLSGKNPELFYGVHNYAMATLTSPLAVNLSPAQPDADYMLFLSWNLATALWWTNKAAGGFSINFLPSPAPANTFLDWAIFRTSY